MLRFMSKFPLRELPAMMNRSRRIFGRIRRAYEDHA